MRGLLGLATLLAIASCVTTNQPDPVLQAFEDFIEIGELPESEEIRHRGNLHYEYLNDYFVLMKTRRENFLVRLARRCTELTDPYTVKPDYRREANVIRSRFDTIRGCRIDKIYPLNPGQVEELKALGDVPGATL